MTLEERITLAMQYEERMMQIEDVLEIFKDTINGRDITFMEKEYASFCGELKMEMIQLVKLAEGLNITKEEKREWNRSDNPMLIEDEDDYETVGYQYYLDLF